MKKTISWFIKAALAGLGAFLLLCLWCSFYYNVPVHYTNETGATEYLWESHKFYRKGTEGFAFGRTNNEGFVNLEDYRQGDEVDILLMGSSHIEAMSVPVKNNAASHLNEFFAGEKYCYNIGTSGHTLAYCLKHLDSALAHYVPTEYVVIETRTVSFSQGELQQMADGEVPDIPSHSGGIVEALQKLPYLRLMYTKYLNDEGGEDAPAAPAETTETELSIKAELLQKVIAAAGESCEAYGVQGIVVYDPTIYANRDGEGYTMTVSEELDMLRSACEENGLWFIDLTESYLAGHQEQHKLPYGFYNTKPGMGHMNSWGHELFARAVHQRIVEKEAGI